MVMEIELDLEGGAASGAKHGGLLEGVLLVPGEDGDEGGDGVICVCIREVLEIGLVGGVVREGVGLGGDVVAVGVGQFVGGPETGDVAEGRVGALTDQFVVVFRVVSAG